LFIVIASLLSVFKIEKPKGTDGGPDAYPYTGFGITYGHHALFPSVGSTLTPAPLVIPFSAARSPFPVPLFQGIEGQRTSSSLNP
jgi:hypothetical protein